MVSPELPPVGVRVSSDVEDLGESRHNRYRARVRWVDPTTGRRKTKSECVNSLEDAQAWLTGITRAARGGVDPISATMKLAAYGEAVMTLATRGLDRETLDP